MFAIWSVIVVRVISYNVVADILLLKHAKTHSKYNYSFINIKAVKIVSNFNIVNART